MENAQLRDRLSFVEGMAGVTTTDEVKGAPASPAAGVSPSSPSSGQPAVHTASNAALIELQELRRSVGTACGSNILSYPVS